MNVKRYLRSGALVALMAFCGMTQAAVIDVIKIGTWNVSPAVTGNTPPPGGNGPGMSLNQKFVVKINYNDDPSAVQTRRILTETFGNSGQDMSVIELTGGDNTIDIFVPMEGRDSGSPFIYTQDESTHLSFFVLEPTVNFKLNSDVSDTANIIGVEFEGDYAGADFNIIELYNTAANSNPASVNQVGQVLNCGNVGCSAPKVAIREVNGLTDAVDVKVTESTMVTYGATVPMQNQTTDLSPQSNDLGAGRSDDETFLDADWTKNGGAALTGAVQLNGVDIAVAIQNSGLTNTISTATWEVTVTEQMTDLSDAGRVLVDYANALPSSTLSATATASGYDFIYSALDADLAINLLIAGFEQLTYKVAVDGVATTLFDSLISSGSLSLTEAVLFNEFGNGLHSLGIIARDLAGAMSTASAYFTVENLSPVPVPPAFALMLTALAFLGVTGFRRRSPSAA